MAAEKRNAPRITDGTAVFCVVTGLLILLLWTMLFATGRLTDIGEKATSYVFHLSAEMLTATLLMLSGTVILRQLPYARRLFYFAGGMLFIAATGMLVFYIVDGYPPFIALGALMVGVTVVFLCRHYAAVSDLVYLALGTVLYAELNVLGNLLQAGDTTTAAYVVITIAVTLPVTVLAFRRSL